MFQAPPAIHAGGTSTHASFDLCLSLGHTISICRSAGRGQRLLIVLEPHAEHLSDVSQVSQRLPIDSYLMEPHAVMHTQLARTC